MDPEQLAMLDEDMREHTSLVDIKDFNGLAKSYINGQTMIGEQGRKMEGAIFKPGDDASEIDKANFYGKLGRPETAEGYTITIPEGSQVHESFISEFKKAAFDRGVSSEHADGLFGWYVDQTIQGTANANAANANTIRETGEALRQEWGADFNNKAAMIDKGINHYFKGDDAERMIRMATADPSFAKAFADIGGGMSENNNTGDKGGSGGGGGGDTLVGIQDERKLIMGDKDHAYFNRSNPGHRDAVDHMSKLTTDMINLQNEDNKSGGS